MHPNQPTALIAGGPVSGVQSTALLVMVLGLASAAQASRDMALSQRVIRLSLLTQGALFVMLLGMGSR